MPRRFYWKECLWLSLPVLAFGLYGPLANYRETYYPTQPRIESAQLREPTAWEAYQGVRVAFTARAVEPLIRHSSEFTMRLTNQAGEKYRSDYREWQEVTEHGGLCSWEEGHRRMVEQRSGLHWEKLAAGGKTVSAQFELNSHGEWPVVSRNFTWANPPHAAALATLRKANFEATAVGMCSSQISGALHYQVNVTFHCAGFTADPIPPVAFGPTWHIHTSLSDESGGGGQSYSVTPAPNGFYTVSTDLDGIYPPTDDAPATLTRLLSVNGGWPQRLIIRLPHGFPSKETTEVLPFSSPLAADSKT